MDFSRPLSVVASKSRRRRLDLGVLLQMKSRAGYGALAVRADDRK
jgi:hypothetical protein